MVIRPDGVKIAMKEERNLHGNPFPTRRARGVMRSDVSGSLGEELTNTDEEATKTGVEPGVGEQPPFSRRAWNE